MKQYTVLFGIALLIAIIILLVYIAMNVTGRQNELPPEIRLEQEEQTEIELPPVEQSPEIERHLERPPSDGGEAPPAESEPPVSPEPVSPTGGNAGSEAKEEPSLP